MTEREWLALMIAAFIFGPIVGRLAALFVFRRRRR